ncbi:isochorismate synthase [Nocardioides insulae]|uniref:isochorismate synthase n=1 Tax=Nocardioides insulae TaxID=394734 RepID=UPI00040871D8|nr:isochorismate synthase [Nocardioides insulae]
MTELLAPLPPGVRTAPVLFAGDESVRAADVLRTLAGPADLAFLDEVVAGLGPGERAVGALAFAPGGPAVMHRVRPDSAVPSSHAPADQAGNRLRVTARPTPGEYAEMVLAALDRIERGDVAKVVLGRGLDVLTDIPLDPHDVVARLVASRPGKYTFGLPLTSDLSAEGPVLVGASPELLVRRRGREVTCHPLAGSVPRAADPDEDLRRSEELATSAKDLAEHAFVVDAILAALAPVCVEVSAAPRPELVATDTLWHLATPIRARLDGAAPGPSALHLAHALHPTPAVGGVPTAAATSLIAELEGASRGPLTGAVGWVGPDGDGEFAVTIRAGVLHRERLRIFAGAGIVAGSDPQAEVRETGAKLATMARAIGLPADLVDAGEVAR